MAKLPRYLKYLAVLFCWPSILLAEPVFTAEEGGIKITLYTEQCVLQSVSNLPVRATWEEQGKVFEGCVGSNTQLRLFVFYFSDKSVVTIPMSAFQRITGV